MSLFDDPPLHDFPDRAIRKLLENPRNLRDLIAAVVPDLAAGFDFERAEPVDRSFLMEDWRGRESDLLVRVPFREHPDERPALVCVLVEHQSAPDPRMPLRMLVYAVLYWEREWKTWEDGHPRGEPLRLSPVLPVVFHTGPDPWATNRTLAELMAGPESLRVFAPQWHPLFWDLAEQSPQALLDSAGDWLKALAVVRAEREETEAFLAVFAEVLRRLEAIHDPDKIRWHDLLWFVLSWALRRRPSAERDRLLHVARASQAGAEDRRELEAMSKVIEGSWEAELTARGEARGELRGCRDDLRLLLEDRFGPLSEELRQRIEATDDLELLRSGLRQVLRINSPDELQL